MVLQEKGRNVVVSRQITGAIADLISPRFCVGCNDRLEVDEKFICLKCIDKIPVISSEGLSRAAMEHFPDGIVDRIISISEFNENSPLRTLIHSLKYHDGYLAGEYLGSLLGVLQKERIEETRIDTVIPVPLHRLRFIERGYNQSYEIAKGLAGTTKLKPENGVVTRSRFTHQQVGSQNRHEREVNMRKAFRVERPLVVAGKNILIVDDVITTGSTVRALATELIEAGASSVHAASILIA